MREVKRGAARTEGERGRQGVQWEAIEEEEQQEGK